MSETHDSYGFRTFTSIKFDGGPLHGQTMDAQANQTFALGSRIKVGEGHYLVEAAIGDPWGPEYGWANWEGS